MVSYLTGDPYSANYIKIDVLQQGSLQSKTHYFAHRDNQGTLLTLTMTNEAATVVEQRYFDAWGNLREAKLQGNNQTLMPNALGWVDGLLLTRGYTGHEHLTTVGLIHMNGRIYDPVLRQFMSPDNFVQDPYNTQNFNRFAYVLNNPLLYTDPSGEELVTMIIIGAAIGVLTKAISNSMAGIPV